MRCEDQIIGLPRLAGEPAQHVGPGIVPARQMRIEMGVVDEGRATVAEEIGLRIEIDALELGITGDLDLRRIDAIGDELFLQLRSGNEAEIELAMVGVECDAAIPRPMGHPDEQRCGAGAQPAFYPQAGPLGRNDRVARLEQRLVQAKTGEPRHRGDLVQHTGRGCDGAGQGEFVPAHARGIFRPDKSFDLRTNGLAGIGDRRLDFGVMPRHSAGDRREVRHLMRRIVIEQENCPGHRRRG